MALELIIWLFDEESREIPLFPAVAMELIIWLLDEVEKVIPTLKLTILQFFIIAFDLPERSIPFPEVPGPIIECPLQSSVMPFAPMIRPFPVHVKLFSITVFSVIVSPQLQAVTPPQFAALRMDIVVRNSNRIIESRAENRLKGKCAGAFM